MPEGVVGEYVLRGALWEGSELLLGSQIQTRGALRGEQTFSVEVRWVLGVLWEGSGLVLGGQIHIGVVVWEGSRLVLGDSDTY